MSSLTREQLLRELRGAREVIDRILTAAKRGAFDKCDCGHQELEHGLIREGPAAGYQPCLVPGCPCIYFDDTHRHGEELLRKYRLAEADVAEREQQEVQRRDDTA
jgi:hypothetical protein